MTERDRFGEKLRDKEKADEDRYFAERDRELIAKRKARMAQETEDVPGEESARMRCPKCAQGLSADTLHGAHVEVCTSGHGIWIDRAELDGLVRREGGGWLTRYLERFRGRRSRV